MHQCSRNFSCVHWKKLGVTDPSRLPAHCPTAPGLSRSSVRFMHLRENRTEVLKCHSLGCDSLATATETLTCPRETLLSLPVLLSCLSDSWPLTLPWMFLPCHKKFALCISPGSQVLHILLVKKHMDVRECGSFEPSCAKRITGTSPFIP